MTEGFAAELADLSYEQARDELAQIVSKLENGNASLEESLALWQRGELLAKHCESWLAGAKAKLAAARQANQDLTVDNSESSDGDL